MAKDVCALAIGGLDPGGGAGIAADLRAFARAGVFGCASLAVLTVQSTAGLRAARPLASRAVVAQAREVLAHQRVRAIKTGALGSAANVRAVAALAEDHPDVPLIVDPVMIPTRGSSRLLASTALTAMRALLAHATLVTANVPEAEALTGARIVTADDARDAAHSLCALGARAALVKAGHLRTPRAADVLAMAGATHVLDAPRLRLPPTHGGGCVLASLIAGRLARASLPSSRPSVDPRALLAAVRWAKRTHARALASAHDVGGPMRVLVP